MYERYNDIESVAKAIKALKDMNESCYDRACQNIRYQLDNAVAYESGYHRDMSKYSSIHTSIIEGTAQ
ncbi:hypothetical protein ACJROX_17425 [Pseudalkalibacillus sp. A8]|uniref:hypothetical protein n=1 Tax=Pseudalkalibacillus sp. A8 TaxID=3382641 RepID=UPI0038B422AB